MNQGRRVLRWASERGYDLVWIAEQIDYAPEVFSDALYQDRITPKLANALLKAFGLRILPSALPCEQEK